MSATFMSVFGILFFAAAATSNTIRCRTPLSYNRTNLFRSMMGNGLMKDRSRGQVKISMDASDSVNSLWLNDADFSDKNKLMAVDLYRLVLWLQNARQPLVNKLIHCRGSSSHRLPIATTLCDPSHLTTTCMDSLESDAFELLRSLAFQENTTNDVITKAMECHFTQLVSITLPKQKRIGCAIFEDGLRHHIYRFKQNYGGFLFRNAWLWH